MGLTELQSRLYDRMRHPEAYRAVGGRGDRPDFSALEGQRYALLTTFRASGDPVPTPVWFGLSRGRAYVRTGAGTAKVKRIRRDPRVRLCPSTVRGRPLGPSSEGRARVLEPEAAQHAEAALQGNYGLGRRLFERTAGAVGDAVYLEIAPAGAAA
jgi:uncharacterized protein